MTDLNIEEETNNNDLLELIVNKEIDRANSKNNKISSKKQLAPIQMKIPSELLKLMKKV